MAGTSQYVRIGAAWVTYGGTDLGYTKGGISMSIDTAIREVMVDAEGPLPQAVFSMGRRVQLTVPLAESEYTRLTGLLNGTNRKIPHLFGENLLDSAADLVVTSIKDPNDYFTVKNAVVIGKVDTRVNFDQERIWAVIFTGYGDVTNVLEFSPLIS